LRSHCRPKTASSAPTPRRSGADRGGDHREGDERHGHPLERGLPLPGDARGENDGESLDGFDDAGDEDGEDQGEGIQ
jgi:hypothetical protein